VVGLRFVLCDGELISPFSSAGSSSLADEPQDAVEASLQKTLGEYQDVRLSEAREAYDKVLNRLWAGNAGGVIAVLTTLRQPVHTLYLIPFLSFAAGLLVLVLGAFIDLRSRHRALREIEAAQERHGTLLSLPLRHWTRPSDEVWLTRIDYAAAASFLLGLIAGVGVFLYVVLCHPTR
jgi:hypothetical protein